MLVGCPGHHWQEKKMTTSIEMVVFFFKKERKKRKEIELLYSPAIPGMNTKECLKVMKTGQGDKGADSSSVFWVTWQPPRPSKSAVCKEVTMYCKDTNIFGSFCRNKLKYLAFLRKQMDTNPSCSPWLESNHSCLTTPLPLAFLSNHTPAPCGSTKKRRGESEHLGKGKGRDSRIF